MKSIIYAISFVLALIIGLYPIVYFINDNGFGILGSKPADLLGNTVWWIAFYTHISLGGIALLSGWPQFISKIRIKYVRLHKSIGILYIFTIMLGGLAGLYIAQDATGGTIPRLGFSLLALLWMGTTAASFWHIKNKKINSHQNWMIRSYALTFAAVSLRIFLPLLENVFNMGFIEAYKVVSFLCWVFNLIVAEIIIRFFLHKKDSKRVFANA